MFWLYVGENEGMKKICSFDNLWTNIQRLDNWYFITPSTVVQELKFNYRKNYSLGFSAIPNLKLV